MSRNISARELANKRFNGLNLSEPFLTLLGEIEPKAYGLWWGPPGSGKSTLVLALANDLASNGAVLYVSAEEGHGKTFANRIKRLQAFHPSLIIHEYESLDVVRQDAKTSKAKFIILDSISEIDPRSTEVQEFRKWAQRSGVGLHIIAHALKSGKGYKGPADVGHGTDFVVEVVDGVAATTKNRYAALAEIAVPFTASDLKQRRKNPSCTCEKCGDCDGWIRSNPEHPGSCAAAKGPRCRCRCGGTLHGPGLAVMPASKPKTKPASKPSTRKPRSKPKPPTSEVAKIDAAFATLERLLKGKAKK